MEGSHVLYSCHRPSAATTAAAATRHHKIVCCWPPHLLNLATAHGLLHLQQCILHAQPLLGRDCCLALHGALARCCCCGGTPTHQHTQRTNATASAHNDTNAMRIVICRCSSDLRLWCRGSVGVVQAYPAFSAAAVHAPAGSCCCESTMKTIEAAHLARPTAGAQGSWRACGAPEMHALALVVEGVYERVF